MSLMKSRNKGEVPEDITNLERIIRDIPDGRATVISYVRQLAITNDSYKEFIRDYDSNKRQDLGAICNTHNIPHNQFLADVMKEAYPVVDEALNLSKIISTKIVAKRLPKVVERGLLEGAKADGIADRHFILQREGFHVAPKGTNITLNQVNQQAAGLPSFEESTQEMASILADADGEVLESHLLTEGDADYIGNEVEKDLERVA